MLPLLFSLGGSAMSGFNMLKGFGGNLADEQATESNNNTHDNKNLEKLNNFNSSMDQMDAIAQQEAENAINGAKIKLATNQMRRANDAQNAMGQIG